jgi:DNA (cytosine-5)-methyltransferase 1
MKDKRGGQRDGAGRKPLPFALPSGVSGPRHEGYRRSMTFTVGSLFSGVGGLDLGFERAGFKVAWMCEADPFCRRVLNKHWPEVPVYEDVRTLRGADVFRPDGLIGGFPCQDVSDSGRHWERDGIDGARSGLWAEYFRLVCELRPRFIAVENVSGLLSRGMGRVLGDLASVGYDAEWESLPAALFGAPHLRARTFVVGYADQDRQSDGTVDDEAPRLPPLVANAEHALREEQRALGRVWRSGQSIPWDANGGCSDPALAVRVDDGLSDRMDRLRGLGNSIVPQVAEWIFRRIQAAEEGRAAGAEQTVEGSTSY